MREYWDLGPNAMKRLNNEHEAVCKENVVCMKLQIDDLLLADVTTAEPLFDTTPHGSAQHRKPLRHGELYHFRLPFTTERQ